MASFVEYLTGDRLVTALVQPQGKGPLAVQGPRGRTLTLAPEKVVFRHSAPSAEELQQRLERLQREVDVCLIWESVQDEPGREYDPRELARLYFGQEDDAHGSALYRALVQEQLHFRRRGLRFAPREAAELQRLSEQRAAAEQAAEQERALAQALGAGKLSAALADRLQAAICGQGDRQLQRVLEERYADPARGAFELLRAAGRLPPTAALEVLQADIRQTHPPAALAHAEQLSLPPPRGEVCPAAFSIDDAETREVDDALSVSQDGASLRVDIDIADVAALVQPDDPVDREARRRATTVYLPTGIAYMLPEPLGCDLGSLHAGQARPVLRTTVWLSEQGRVEGHELHRATARVARRLTYEEADRLLQDGADPSAEASALRTLNALATRRRALRRERGALFLQRREWKIRVHDGGARIDVHPIEIHSPARALVGEMMVLANGLAAQEAALQGTPIIFRTQAAPADPLPEVDLWSPAAFEMLRGLIKPAALSLQPAPHWGLGLDAYCQITSPLRRYGDLALQRQLAAVMEGRPPPHDAEQLYKVLATAEATEREAKRAEAAVTARWALEFVARQHRGAELEAVVMRKHTAGGYLVELSLCGARGILVDDRRHELGDRVPALVQRVRPEQGTLRLQPAS